MEIYKQMNMNTEIIKDIIFQSSSIAILTAAIIAIFKFGFEYLNIKSKNKLREEYKTLFNKTVTGLSSSLKSTQLTSAILLRRFLTKEVQKKAPNLTKETINVISSLAKTLPTNIFQKTLVDGLSYTKDLSFCDLQKTNLQDALLGNKKHQLIMNNTDLFLADLSYANLNNIIGHNICFYRSILFCTRIKNCDFSNADFRNADLSGIYLENCTLNGANFTDAINIPQVIKDNLDNGICKCAEKITTEEKTTNKTIFFSMPGIMSKNDESLTKEYKKILEKRGYNVIYYTSDKYPQFGQFNKVRADILRSSGMIAFGLKQLNIKKASYRPNTIEEANWEEKWLSTPWSEIEVGMGLMKGMPILLVTDPDITDGVFDDNLSECFVSKISTTEDCRKLEQNKSFEEWISKT